MKRYEQVLAAYAKAEAEGQRPPTSEEVSRCLGITASSVRTMVANLRKRGFHIRTKAPVTSHSGTGYKALTYDEKAEYCLYLLKNPGATVSEAIAHACAVGE